MELTVWDSSQARAAAAWAEKCKWEHNRSGQNMARFGDSKNLTPVIQAFYNEKEHYYFDTDTCRKWPCGHYTQVVWASSRYVGCGVNRCPKWAITVCNYKPRGNVIYRKTKRGPRPYKKGPACSKSPNGAGWCKNKLCNWQCLRAGKGCSCTAICYNCATLDLETCQCKCAKGWHGVDCSVRCKNTHRVCEVDLNAEEGLCPPVRGPAADSAQTMFITIVWSL